VRPTPLERHVPATTSAIEAIVTPRKPDRTAQHQHHSAENEPSKKRADENNSHFFPPVGLGKVEWLHQTTLNHNAKV